MREDADGNKSPQLDADGNPMYRELDNVDYEILGRDKQVGAEMRDGVVVSNSFNDRFIGMSPEKQQETLGKLVDDDFHVRRAEGMKGSKPEVTIPATFKTQDLDGVTEIRPRSQPDIDHLDDLATRRKAQIGNPSELRGYSEQIGEAAADAHANAHGLTPIYTGSGAYTLDKVYQKGDTFYVFEAKGGGSTLGGKKVDIINEATGDLHIAEQGSREYLEKTIQDMASSRDLRKMEMAEDLQNALDRGKVKYMVVQQKLTKAGDIGEFTIKEFDITK